MLPPSLLTTCYFMCRVRSTFIYILLQWIQIHNCAIIAHWILMGHFCIPSSLFKPTTSFISALLCCGNAGHTSQSNFSYAICDWILAGQRMFSVIWLNFLSTPRHSCSRLLTSCFNLSGTWTCQIMSVIVDLLVTVNCVIVKIFKATFTLIFFHVYPFLWIFSNMSLHSSILCTKLYRPNCLCAFKLIRLMSNFVFIHFGECFHKHLYLWRAVRRGHKNCKVNLIRII